MNELWSKIYARYGGIAIVVAVTLAVAVWALAHFAAAPGKPVKILWGLVEYTKPPTSTSPGAEMPPKLVLPQPNTGTAMPEVVHGLTSDNYMKTITAIRSVRGLRELRPLESDRSISDSPQGTFFFVSAIDLRFLDPAKSVNVRISRFQNSPFRHFELHHHRTGKIVVLVYLSEPDADRIRKLTGEREFQLTLAPQPWGAFSSLVELHIERIFPTGIRRLEVDEKRALSVLDVTVR